MGTENTPPAAAEPTPVEGGDADFEINDTLLDASDIENAARENEPADSPDADVDAEPGSNSTETGDGDELPEDDQEPDSDDEPSDTPAAAPEQASVSALQAEIKELKELVAGLKKPAEADKPAPSEENVDIAKEMEAVVGPEVAKRLLDVLEKRDAQRFKERNGMTEEEAAKAREAQIYQQQQSNVHTHFAKFGEDFDPEGMAQEFKDADTLIGLQGQKDSASRYQAFTTQRYLVALGLKTLARHNASVKAKQKADEDKKKNQRVADREVKGPGGAKPATPPAGAGTDPEGDDDSSQLTREEVENYLKSLGK